MAVKPVTFERFGGLNLVDDPLEVGPTGATHLENVWFTENGKLGAAPRVDAFATATRTVRGLGTHAAIHLLTSEADGTNVTLNALDSSGASVASTTFASAINTAHAFATIGTPSASKTYAVRTSGTTRVWDGAAWATAAGVPLGTCVAAADNGTRLAVGSPSGNVHRVSFSDPGDPETFGATNYVDITPGDGEQIFAMVAWGGNLFVFKQTKFAVFYGVSTDADGNPVFNYRMVEARGVYSHLAAVEGTDGVYFMSKDGVYRTRGSWPELISGPISPLWDGSRAALTEGLAYLTPSAGACLGWIGSDLYVSCAGRVDNALKHITLVFSKGQWSYTDIQENGTDQTRGAVVEFFGTPHYSVANSTAIRRLSWANVATSTLAWFYKSGRYALADPGVVAVTNETSLVGCGTVTLRLDSDIYTNQNGSATLGTFPATAEGWPGAVDQEGTWLQYTLSGTGPASVSRLTHHIQAVKPVGVR